MDKLTKETLLEQIRSTLTSPISWEAAGLGGLPPEKVKAFIDERARNLAAWIWIEMTLGVEK